jgi:hypothetical protein
MGQHRSELLHHQVVQPALNLRLQLNRPHDTRDDIDSPGREQHDPAPVGPRHRSLRIGAGHTRPVQRRNSSQRSRRRSGPAVSVVRFTTMLDGSEVRACPHRRLPIRRQAVQAGSSS